MDTPLTGQPTTAASRLDRDIRCTVHGAPGTVRYLTPDGAMGVALDGELTVDGRQRIDLWAASQVEVAS